MSKRTRKKTKKKSRVNKRVRKKSRVNKRVKKISRVNKKNDELIFKTKSEWIKKALVNKSG